MNRERRRIIYPVLVVPIVSSLIAFVLDSAQDFGVFVMSFTAIPMLALTIISNIKGFNGYEYSAVTLLIGWHVDSSFSRLPNPRRAIFFAVSGYVLASLFIFSVNAILACTKGRKARTEEELESIVAPTLEGLEYDDRIMKWTEVPRAIVCGGSLGCLCAAGIHYLMK